MNSASVEIPNERKLTKRTTKKIPDSAAGTLVVLIDTRLTRAGRFVTTVVGEEIDNRGGRGGAVKAKSEGRANATEDRPRR